MFTDYFPVEQLLSIPTGRIINSSASNGYILQRAIHRHHKHLRPFSIHRKSIPIHTNFPDNISANRVRILIWQRKQTLNRISGVNQIIIYCNHFMIRVFPKNIIILFMRTEILRYKFKFHSISCQFSEFFRQIVQPSGKLLFWQPHNYICGNICLPQNWLQHQVKLRNTRRKCRQWNYDFRVIQ